LISPTITMTYVVADQAAPADRRTGAGAMVNSVYNAGNSFGSASAGLLLGGCPLGVCFVLAALPAWLAAAGGLATGRRRAAPTTSPTSTKCERAVRFTDPGPAKSANAARSERPVT
jgi:predicted MFS family arabinose efflux permease